MLIQILVAASRRVGRAMRAGIERPWVHESKEVDCEVWGSVVAEIFEVESVGFSICASVAAGYGDGGAMPVASTRSWSHDSKAVCGEVWGRVVVEIFEVEFVEFSASASTAAGGRGICCLYIGWGRQGVCRSNETSAEGRRGVVVEIFDLWRSALIRGQRESNHGRGHSGVFVAGKSSILSMSYGYYGFGEQVAKRGARWAFC